MDFVCPACKKPLSCQARLYFCKSCNREFPVLCGIADFRLHPDPYIGIEQDRAKAELLFDAGRSRDFQDLVRFYYSITEEDPPDLACRWRERALQEVEIARFVLRESRSFSQPVSSGGRWLDIGCSTGALLAAVKDSASVLVGVDVALRWLIVGLARLREEQVEALLVCANAEALPFPDSAFTSVSATDLIEHVRDAAATLAEARRVAVPGAPMLWTTNNRFAPVPEPHVRLWGVGFLPRQRQPDYVAWRRRDLHRYQVVLRSARELEALFAAAGYGVVKAEAAALYAPHWRRRIPRVILRLYNRFRTLPVIRGFLRAAGPRLWIRTVR